MPPITIYSTPTCPFCQAAIRLLCNKKLDFTLIDVTHDPKKRAEMAKRAGDVNTVPQIWIGPRHVGGSDELHALDAAGDLDRLIDGTIKA